MTKISAVLPLKTKGRHYIDNIARCDILFSSLRHFTTPDTFDRFIIIVPHDEFAEAKEYAKAWQDFPVMVVDESEHLPTFAEFNQRHQIRPWHRQQIIKLYAPALVSTDFFLVFDPDVFAIQPFTIDSLIRDGRAITHYERRRREERFWIDSSKVLQCDPGLDGNGLWWTPAILSTELCRNLHRRLETLYQTDWTRVLLSRYTIDWTEYTLYWLNAEQQGLLEKYHLPMDAPPPTLHAEESVWFAGKGDSLFKAWDAARHFGPEENGLFAVIQSNTRITPADVVAKLGPYFPISQQHYTRRESLGLTAAELYSAAMRRALRVFKG
jgi:hypothetical protein